MIIVRSAEMPGSARADAAFEALLEDLRLYREKIAIEEACEAYGRGKAGRRGRRGRPRKEGSRIESALCS